jgi:hypothetical protein
MKRRPQTFRPPLPFIAALLLSASPGLVLAAGHWLPVTGSDCTVWSDQPLDSGEVILWSGGCEDDRLSGTGTLEVSGGQGPGLWFEGRLSAGKANGIGQLKAKQADGGIDDYQGGFKDSLFDGYGVYEAADGSRYEGGFKADHPDGYGVYKGADGSSYQGEVRDGAANGTGFEQTADGGRYHGEFRDGERNGKGTLLFADGAVYEGGFLNGQADGAGKFIDATGDSYVGSWNAGKANGVFTVTWADGISEQQQWKDDQPVTMPTSGAAQ